MQYSPTVYVNDKIPTSVTIPKNIREIGDYAFYGWRDTKEFIIHDDVTHIGKCAFYDSECYNTKSNWVDGVLYLGTSISVKKQENASYTKIFVWYAKIQPIAQETIIEL